MEFLEESIYLGEIEYLVSFDYISEEPQTFLDPGYPASVEIFEVQPAGEYSVDDLSDEDWTALEAAALERAKLKQ